MKKVFSKLTVIVLALLFSFSLAACGDVMVKVDNVPEAITGATDAMVQKDGFTVKAEITGVLSQLSPSGFQLNAKVKKAQNDYDFDATLSYAMMSFQVQNRFIKKGTALYSGSDLAGYTQSEIGTVDISQGVEALKQITESIDMGELKKGKDSYTLGGELDFGTVAETVRMTLVGLKDVPLGGLLASMLGDEYTVEELIADINDILADTNTVKVTVNKLDAFFVKMGIPVTVKQIADAILPELGITAQDVYEQIVEMLGGNGNVIGKPSANETAYDYIINKAGNLSLKMLWSKAVPEYPLATVRSFIAEALGDEEVTVGSVWDMVAGMIDSYISPVFGIIAEEAGYTKIAESGLPLLAMENLAKMRFSVGKTALNIELNGSDLSLKNVNFTFNCTVSYDSTALVKLNIGIHASFAYDKVGDIAAPTKIIESGDESDFDFGSWM